MKISQIAKFQNGFPFQSELLNSLRQGLPVIRIKELKLKDVVITDDTLYFAENADAKYQVACSDILVSLTGDPVSKGNPNSWVGRTCRYRYSFPALLNQRICKVIPDKSKVDPRYLFYLLALDNSALTLANCGKGSANQANISHNDIANLDSPIHSLPEQRHIVDLRRNAA